MWHLTVHVVHTSDLAQILETVEQINTIKLQREFYLGFAQNPQKFINEWLASQSRDLKVRSVCSCIVVTVNVHIAQALLSQFTWQCGHMS